MFTNCFTPFKTMPGAGEPAENTMVYAPVASEPVENTGEEQDVHTPELPAANTGQQASPRRSKVLSRTSKPNPRYSKRIAIGKRVINPAERREVCYVIYINFHFLF